MQTRSNKIDCRKAQTYAQLLLDGRLTSNERAKLDSHLIGCSACALMVDDLRKSSQHLAAWTPSLNKPAPDSSFNAKIMLAISNDTAPESLSSNGTNRWKIGLAIACASAFCIAFSVLGGYQMPAALQSFTHGAVLTQGSSIPAAVSNLTRDPFADVLNNIDQFRAQSLPSWLAIAGCAGVVLNILFAAQAMYFRKTNHAV
jgi:anti-sigma factor RsiW